MKIKNALFLFIAVLTGHACWSQATVVEDFKPSTLNQPGQEYPQVNSQGYVRFRIVAPYADSVKVSLGLGGLLWHRDIFARRVRWPTDGLWRRSLFQPARNEFQERCAAAAVDCRRRLGKG